MEMVMMMMMMMMAAETETAATAPTATKMAPVAAPGTPYTAREVACQR